MSSERPSGASVVDGVCVRTSVSALQKADSCLRAWWYRYVKQLPEKPIGKGAARGKLGHARIEEYLRNGVTPTQQPELYAIQAGFVTRPATPAYIEIPLSNIGPLDVCGVPLIGFIDYVQFHPTEERVEVIDWKFKKSIAQWGARRDDLASPTRPEGIQMLGYAETIRRARKYNRYTLTHVTMQTEGEVDVKRTSVTVTADEVRNGWQNISERLGPQIIQAAKTTEDVDVDCDTKSCRAYGGCDYASICPAVSQSRRVNDVLTSKIGEMKMGLLGNLTVKPVTPTPTPSPVVTEEPKKRRLVIEEAPAPVAVEASDSVIDPLAVLPPDALDFPPSPAPVEAAPVVVVAEEPKKRVRRTKAQMEADAALSAPAPVITEKVQEPVISPPSLIPSVQTHGLHLYFGCAPVGVATSTLHEYVDGLDAFIRSALGVAESDIRLAESSALAYGKWRAHIARVAAEAPPAPGHYVVNGTDERVHAVADALCKKASLIVYGAGR